jgi:hypothetical protein
MYVCIRYKSVLGHVCMCQIQESDRSCMYVSDTRECSVMYACIRYKSVIGHVCMCKILSCIITIEINKSINNMIDVNVLLW